MDETFLPWRDFEYLYGPCVFRLARAHQQLRLPHRRYSQANRAAARSSARENRASNSGRQVVDGGVPDNPYLW